MPWAAEPTTEAKLAKPVVRNTCPSDEDLMRRLASRDESALSELFDRYAPLVFGIALRVIRDQGEAEDTVQEVFLHLTGHSEKFDPAKGTVRAWLSHLTVHKALDRRAFLARRRFYDGTDLTTVEDTITEDYDLEADVHERFVGSQVRQVLEQLPPKQRITLEWFFFDGYSLREIGERLGETHFNARHHFYRGLDKLRKSPLVARLRGSSCYVRERAQAR